MISAIDTSGDPFLTNLRRLQQQFNKTEQELSSGKRVTSPADAPDQIEDLLNFRAQSAANAQTQKNLTRLQDDTSAADQAIGASLRLVDQALAAGAQGATPLQTDATRADLAAQVRQIHQQILGIANTEFNGRYIFSGDQDQAVPYAASSTSPNGVTQLHSAANTKLVDDGSGTLSSASLTAEVIFDHRNADGSNAPDNVFAALFSLADALQSNDQAAIVSAQATLRQSSTYLNSKQTFYGNWEARITNAVNSAEEQATSLQARTSAIEDVDVAQAAVELTQEQTSLQAAYSGQTRAPQKSLFDYLG